MIRKIGVICIFTLILNIANIYAVTINDVENTNLDSSDKHINDKNSQWYYNAIDESRNIVVDNIKATKSNIYVSTTSNVKTKNDINTLSIETLQNISIIKSTEETVGPETFIKDDVYEHDGVYYKKGQSMGNFMLTGYCACKKCSSGTGITASGKPVRENHTIASDWKVLPKGTVIILENAVGKDGTPYNGVYVVEDRGGGVKNQHLDIYRPTHDLAALVTAKGRCYGDVYIAEPIDITKSKVIK